MVSRRVVYAVVSVMVIAGVAGGVWWHGRGSGESRPEGRQTVGNHMISLDQQQSPSDDSGGLSVSAGGASDLGQLGGGDKQSLGASGTSGASDGTSTPDFTKYDKYKTAKSALFGDITKGTGAELTGGRKATVYYKGWLTNGALIDQSPVSKDGQLQPFAFTMGRHEVISGWEEGLYGMKAGGVRLVIVPPAAGYGSEGKGAVPPDAVLVFEIRLINVQ